MTQHECDSKCLALLRERAQLQHEFRLPLARIQEIERQIPAIEAEYKAQEETKLAADDAVSDEISIGSP